jgi:hypothetical protein
MQEMASVQDGAVAIHTMTFGIMTPSITIKNATLCMLTPDAYDENHYSDSNILREEIVPILLNVIMMGDIRLNVVASFKKFYA